MDFGGENKFCGELKHFREMFINFVSVVNYDNKEILTPDLGSHAGLTGPSGPPFTEAMFLKHYDMYTY